MANKKVLSGLVVAALFALAALIVVLAPSGKSGPSGEGAEHAKKPRIADASRAGSRRAAEGRARRGGEEDAEEADGEEENCTDGETAAEQSPEEKLAEEEEALVDAFDDMTDKFREIGEDKEVSMDDVKKFHEQFKKVPKARKEECLQRALNLLPDENIMLLAGILMDKEEDKELVELVFNDILNREEEMKTVLLKEIYKDKSHPCWADTAWILDVTGKGEPGNAGAANGEAGNAEAGMGEPAKDEE
jgi:hypothetical protein